MMGACGADDDVGVLLRQKFKKQRFQMIDDSSVTGESEVQKTSPVAFAQKTQFFCFLANWLR